MKRPRLSLSSKIAGAFAGALVAVLASAPAASATEPTSCVTADDPIGVYWGANLSCFEGSGKYSFGGGLPNVKDVAAGKWSGWVTFENSRGDWVVQFSPQETVHLDGAKLLLLEVN
jgi:hypothetical protein